MNRLLRQIRRLKAQAAPLIAERNRRDKHWLENVVPAQAEEHLLRMILVFRYGTPRIDEPLALAHERALLKLGVDEASSVMHLRGILEKESPDGDIKSQITTWVGQSPDWLRLLCFANISMNVLGLEAPRLLYDSFKLWATKSDEHAWPLLPQGMLEPNVYWRPISLHSPLGRARADSARRPDRRRSSRSGRCP
jgi:hypothetical protein